MRNPLIWAAVLAAFLFGGPAVVAHGDATWIMEGEWSECCGPADCKWLAPGDVQAQPNGWYVKSRGEYFPFDKTLPNQDPAGHHFWLCVDLSTGEDWQSSETRRVKGYPCFFGPQPRI